MIPSCSGVVLAGGQNLRFSKENKAMITIDGKRIVDRILQVFTHLFREVVLVTNAPQAYLDWDIHVVSDMIQIRSPLTGIHSGLFHISSPHAFFCACDMPFLKTALVEAIASAMEPNVDVVLPETADGLQPLFAVYSKRCLRMIEDHLIQQPPNQNKNRTLQPGLKIQRFFKKLRVKKIPESFSRKYDPDLISFFNINTPEDLLAAKKIVNTLEDETKEASNA